MTYAFTHERLDNGLRVVMCEDHAVPNVTVDVTYRVGAAQQRPGQTELAHLFEHLMFEGSQHLGKGEYMKQVGALGGSVNAMTSADYTTYFETAPSHHLERLLWLEAERLATLADALDQEKLDNQRDVVLNEHRQRRENVPYGSAHMNLLELAYPQGHPYHRTMADIDDLQRFSLDDITTFFRSYYAPNNAVLSIVGDIDGQQALQWAERYFGPLPPNDAIPPPRDTTVTRTGGEVRRTVVDAVPLPRVLVAWLVPPDGSPEYDAVEVAVRLLGDGRGSRLHRRLVVDDEVAVDARMHVTGATGGASLAIATATARHGVDVATVEAAIHDTIAGLRRSPPTGEELQRVRARIERSTLDRLEPILLRALALAVSTSLFGDPGRVNERPARLLQLDDEDIRLAADRWFTADSRVVVTYLPEGS